MERRAGEEPALSDIIFDFRDVVGMDSSALMAFRRIGQIAEEKNFRVAFAGLDADLRDFFERAKMWREGRVLCIETADRALQFAEDRLAAKNVRGRVPHALTLSDVLATFAPGEFSADRLAPYLEHVKLEPNQVLMHLGDPADAMFFVESGQVDEAARAAEPNSEAEAMQMAAAEAEGKRHAKGEDPALSRKASQKQAGADDTQTPMPGKDQE